MGAGGELHTKCLTIGRLVNRLDQVARVQGFLNHASHHGPEHLAFESWMSLEAKLAITHRQNDLGREYVKILDNNDIQGKKRASAAVDTCTSKCSVVINVVKGVPKETRGRKARGT